MFDGQPFFNEDFANNFTLGAGLVVDQFHPKNICSSLTQFFR